MEDQISKLERKYNEAMNENFEWMTLWPGHFFFDFKMPDGRAPRWSRSPGEYS